MQGLHLKVVLRFTPFATFLLLSHLLLTPSLLLPCSASVYVNGGGLSAFAPLEATSLTLSQSLSIKGVNVFDTLQLIDSQLTVLQANQPASNSDVLNTLIATVQSQGGLSAQLSSLVGT